MKKLLLLSLCCFMAACDKGSIEVEPPPPTKYTIKVSNDTQTKTTLGDDKMTVSWAAGDQIHLVLVGDTLSTVFTYVPEKDNHDDGCSVFESDIPLPENGKYRGYYVSNRENAIICEPDGVTLNFIGPKQNIGAFGDVACMYTPEAVSLTITDETIETDSHFHFVHLLTYMDISVTVTNQDYSDNGLPTDNPPPPRTLKRVLLIANSNFRFATRIKIVYDGESFYEEWDGEADRVALEYPNDYSGVYMGQNQTVTYTGVLGFWPYDFPPIPTRTLAPVVPLAHDPTPRFNVYAMFSGNGMTEEGDYAILRRSRVMPETLGQGNIYPMNLESDYITDESWQAPNLDVFMDSYYVSYPELTNDPNLFNFPPEPWEWRSE